MRILFYSLVILICAIPALIGSVFTMIIIWSFDKIAAIKDKKE